MLNKLEDFNKKTRIINKDLSIYEDDEKGTIFALNTVNLLCRVDYLELNKEQFNVARFQNKIEDLEYNTITIKKPIPKYDLTKKEEDKYTLIEKEEKVKAVWNVSNTAGAIKSFTNKEEALKYANEINDNVLSVLTK